MTNIQFVINEALRLYLDEYGEDGYNKDTFIDYIVANVTHPEGDVYTLIDYYRRRADAIEANIPK